MLVFIVLMASFVMIPLGVVLLLWGYKVFRIYLAITGFITGFTTGFAIILSLSDALLALIGGLLLGAIFAIAFYYLFLVGIFIIGFLIGSLIGLPFLFLIQEAAGLIFMLIFGLIGGIFAIFIRKFIIILSTSWTGAGLIVTPFILLILVGYMGGMALDFSFDPFNLNQVQALTNAAGYIMAYYILSILFQISLTIFGMLYQYGVINKQINAFLPEQVLILTGENRAGTRPDFDYDYNSTSNVGRFGYNKEKDNYRQDFNRETSQGEMYTDKPTSFDEQFYDHDKEYRTRDFNKDSNFTQSNPDDQKTVKFTPDEQVDLNAETYKINSFPVKLQQLNGDMPNSVHTLSGINDGTYIKATIGRGSGSDPAHITIPDSKNLMSRIHAEIILHEGNVYIRSMNDYNQVSVNGKNVSSNNYEPLDVNDRISLNYVDFLVIN